MKLQKPKFANALIVATLFIIVALTSAVSYAYSSKYVTVSGSNAETIGKECDAIIERLIERYGEPRTWKQFPVIFTVGGGGRIAGYTSYQGGVVKEVVVYQTFDVARGGTLDHELTHAFAFYWLNSNFDLFFNEGIAQNSEYRRRATLRQIVYQRYNNGDFIPLNKLYGLGSYDSNLLIYHEGFSVVDFLIARGGSKWFIAFLDALTNEKLSIETALKHYYGYSSLKELELEWTNYVESGQDRRAVQPVE